VAAGTGAHLPSALRGQLHGSDHIAHVLRKRNRIREPVGLACVPSGASTMNLVGWVTLVVNLPFGRSAVLAT
jgi:hypothetical protein